MPTNTKFVFIAAALAFVSAALLLAAGCATPNVARSARLPAANAPTPYPAPQAPSTGLVAESPPAKVPTYMVEVAGDGFQNDRENPALRSMLSQVLGVCAKNLGQPEAKSNYPCSEWVKGSTYLVLENPLNKDAQSGEVQNFQIILVSLPPASLGQPPKESSALQISKPHKLQLEGWLDTSAQNPDRLNFYTPKQNATHPQRNWQIGILLDPLPPDPATSRVSSNQMALKDVLEHLREKKSENAPAPQAGVPTTHWPRLNVYFEYRDQTAQKSETGTVATDWIMSPLFGYIAGTKPKKPKQSTNYWREAKPCASALCGINLE